MDDEKRKLAIVGLNEVDLDVIPALARDPGWDIVLLADADASSMALRIGELMKLPTTSNLGDLVSKEFDVVLCGSPDVEGLLRVVLKRDILTVGPAEILSVDLAEKLEAEPESEPEVELNLDECKVLGTLSETLSLALDKQRLLKWILELAIECTGAETGSVMLLDETGQELRIAVAQGLSEEMIRTTRRKLGEGIAGKVAKEGRPLLISGGAPDELLVPGKERSDVKAALCVPLIARDLTIGVLNVNSSRDPLVFQERDLCLLEKLAERVTDVLKKAIEYSSIANKTLEFTLREAVEEELAKDLPFEDKIRLLASSLSRKVGSDCYIYLPDKGKAGKLILYGNSVESTEPSLPEIIFAGKGFLGRALTSRKPQVLLPARSGAPDGESEDLGIVCVPMRAERWRGLLVFDSVKVTELELESFLGAFERVSRFIGMQLGREVSLLGLKEQAEALAELNRVASSLIAAHRVEEVVRIIAQEGARIIKADVCLIACEDGRSWFVNQLQGTEGLEEDERVKKAREFLIAESLKEMAFVSSETVDEALRLEVDRLGISSFMAGPLMGAVRSLGVCMVLRMKEGERDDFTGSESDLFSSFCSYAAHGLERAVVSTQAQQSGEIDKETGLPGARTILKKIEEEAERYDRYGMGFCISVMEIEGLTGAFQKLGDQWRAAFLEEFSGGLRKTIREVDIVGRTGESIFVVVSPQTPREGGPIMRRIEDLLKRLGAVRYVSPAPELGFKSAQLYWPKDICDHEKVRLLISGSVE